MTNIQAAILFGQLTHYKEILEMKDRVFSRYRKELSGIPGVEIQQIEPDTVHSNWMMGVRVCGSQYGYTQKFFNENGIDIRQFFYPISSHAHYSHVPIQDDSVSRLLNQEVFMVPSYPELKKEDQDRVIETIKQYSKLILDLDK